MVYWETCWRFDSDNLGVGGGEGRDSFLFLLLLQLRNGGEIIWVNLYFFL